MTWRVLLPTLCAWGVALLTTMTGCGTSGSEPVLFPEVRFEVSPTTGAPFQFVAERFDIGGVEYTDLAGTTLTGTATGEGGALSVFRIVFENAPPSYCGTLRQVGAAAITVHLLQEGTGIETSSTTSGDGTTVTTCILGSPAPMPVAPNPAVRFDVCAPSLDLPSCAAAGGDPGRFGVQFSGVIGDPFVTYLLGTGSSTVNPPAFVPAIYYFQGASQTVNAVFTGFNGAELSVQFFINGQLNQNATGGGNLVFEQDL